MPERGARFGGHPVHPALVSLPIGLWTFSLAADLVHGLGGGSIWQDLALYTLGAGIVGAVIAAVPGFIDYLTISDGRVRDIAVEEISGALNYKPVKRTTSGANARHCRIGESRGRNRVTTGRRCG